jgi:hypothetical protein
MIARLESSSQRIFPPIQPTLYSPNQDSVELSPDRQVTQQLLSLSHRELTRWQLWCGWKLDAEGQLAHLLLQHRLAIAAELSAQWQQADFFWNQVYIGLKALSEKAWGALSTIAANHPGVTVVNNSAQLRQRFVDELLIDTHCAFYNGLVQQEKNRDPNDRAFVHIDYIQRLLAFSALTREESAALLKSPWQERIQACRKKGRWKQAGQICSLRLRYLPSIEYQNELAEVNYAAAIAQTSPVVTLYASHIRLSDHLKQPKRSGLQRVRIWFTQLSQKYPVHLKVTQVGRALQNRYPAAVDRIRQIVGWLYRIKDARAVQRVMTGLWQLCQKFLLNPKMVPFRQKIAQLLKNLRIDCTYFLAQIRQETFQIRQLRDARVLRRSILALEKQGRDYPPNLKVFQFLSELHYRRAIKLRNADRLSTALIAVHQAIAYNPEYNQPIYLRDDLAKTMEQLTAAKNHFKMNGFKQLRIVLKNLMLVVSILGLQEGSFKQLRTVPQNPFSILSILHSRRLYKQAKRGFAPMQKYLKSTAVQITASNVRLAKAIDLWRNIGLAEPSDRWQSISLAEMRSRVNKILIQKTDGSAEQALLLLDAVNQVSSQPLTSRASVAEAWQTVLAQHPKLADCDPPLVQAFLERQLFDTTDTSPTVMAPTLDTFNLFDNAPILLPVSTQPKLEPEPLLPWLFSRQDIRLKAQATIASLLVLTTGGLLIRESIVRTTRNTTYQQILSAHQQQEYLAVLEGAEAFLSHAPLSGKDDRSQQVKQLYSEALVRWLAQQSNQPQSDVQQRIDRYRVLTSQAK